MGRVALVCRPPPPRPARARNRSRWYAEARQEPPLKADPHHKNA